VLLETANSFRISFYDAVLCFIMWKAVSIPLITEDVKLADVIKNSVSFFTNIANMIFKDLKRGG